MATTEADAVAVADTDAVAQMVGDEVETQSDASLMAGVLQAVDAHILSLTPQIRVMHGNDNPA